jgi:hypothetical protein
MKARGYRIVHVVPATADRPATPTEPRQWLLHPAPDAIAQWPEVPNFVFADLGSLPAPARSEFDVATDVPTLHQPSLPRTAWPEPSGPEPGEASVALAAPAPSVFEVEGNLDIALRNATHISRRTLMAASNAAETGGRRLSRRELRRVAHSRNVRLAHSGRQAHAGASKSKKPGATTSRHTPAKRLVQVRKRHV